MELHDLCLATAGFLSLGGTTEPHYIKRIGFDLDPYCFVSQHQKKSACILKICTDII